MNSTIDLIDKLPLMKTANVVLPWDEGFSICQTADFRSVPNGCKLEMKVEFKGVVEISDELIADSSFKDHVVRDIRVNLKVNLFNDTLAFLREMRYAAYKRHDRELVDKIGAFESRLFSDGSK